MVIAKGTIVGPTIAGLVFLAIAVSHRATYRDPYRNFLTQLIDAWYSNWHEPAERRIGLLRFMSLGYFVMAGGAFAFAIFQIVRANF